MVAEPMASSTTRPTLALKGSAGPQTFRPGPLGADQLTAVDQYTPFIGGAVNVGFPRNLPFDQRLPDAQLESRLSHSLPEEVCFGYCVKHRSSQITDVN